MPTGVGLGEYVRHLAMIDYVVFSGSLEGQSSNISSVFCLHVILSVLFLHG